jgi:hypothetical protein
MGRQVARAAVEMARKRIPRKHQSRYSSTSSSTHRLPVQFNSVRTPAMPEDG